MVVGAITALSVATFLVWIFKTKYWDPSKSRTTIPGLKSYDSNKGNMEQIAKAGSFPKFLQELHSQFGPIASFWFGPLFTVSLTKADQFKKTAPLFDRKPEMFEFIRPLFCSESIQFQNGVHGRDLYKRLSLPFSHGPSLSLAPSMTKLAKKMCQNWTDGYTIDLHGEMMKLALHNITSLQFGESFHSDKLVERFHNLYTFLMNEMDDELDGLRNPNDAESQEKFDSSLEEFREIIRKVVYDHKEKKETGDYASAPFLDSLLDYTDDMDEILAQSITFMVAGFHTTGNALTWSLYYLSLHPEVQEKARREVEVVVGERGVEEQEDLHDLVYIRQVISESLRLAREVPFSSRIASKNMTIDGYSIPEGTHLLHALCLSLMDPQVFPHPEKFDPDRFAPDNMSFRSLANSPFGFGVRKCPGYKFANMEMVTSIAVVLNNFRLKIPEKEKGKRVEPKFGFSTKPREDIWIEVQKLRN